MLARPSVPIATSGTSFSTVVMVCKRPAPCTPRRFTNVSSHTIPIATAPLRVMLFATAPTPAPSADAPLAPRVASMAIGLDERAGFASHDLLDVRQRAYRGSLTTRRHELARGGDLGAHAAGRKVVLCELGRRGPSQT